MLNFLGFSSNTNSFDDYVANFTKIEKLSNKNNANTKKDFVKYLENIMNLLVEEDKIISNPKTKIEKNSNPKLNYFIEKEKLMFLFNFAEKNLETCLEIFLKFLKHIIREIKNPNFLNNRSIIDTLRNVLINLNCYLKIEDNSFSNIRQCTSELIYEISQKFFDFPNLMTYMTVRTNDFERNSEENLIFAMIINLFKNDQMLPDRASKKNIRRALIICFSFEEVYESEYVIEDSFVCEIIIEKLIYYFLLTPIAFELENQDFVLDIAYNIKQTFPSMYKKYFDFWDFIYFINKFFNTIRCLKLKERLKLLFFNGFLLKYIQERLCSCNLKVIRSTLQYVILMVTLINDQEIINLIYNFIFGFSDSKTNYVFTYNTEEETSSMAETLSNSNASNSNIASNSSEKQNKKDILSNSGKKNSISYTHSRTNSINSVLSKNFNLLNGDNNYNSNSNNNIDNDNNNNKNNNNNNNSKTNQNTNPDYLSTKNSEENQKTNFTSTEYEEALENNFYLNQDYNFKAHNNIRIALKIFNNMNNEEERINLVISVLFEKFFEKCPFFMFNRLVFPFAEFCLRQIDDPNKFLKVKKTIPDLDSLYNLVKLYDDAKSLSVYFESNIKAISFSTLNHYVRNDIDFYFYYLNQRQDEENYDYYNEDEKNNKEKTENDLIYNEGNNNDVNENENFDYCDSKQANGMKPRFSVRAENKEIVNPSNFANANIDRESIKKVFQTPKKLKASVIISNNNNINLETPKNNENLGVNNNEDDFNDMRLTLSKMKTKFSFNYFYNTKKKINLKPKLFDELIQTEEEFNNIYILFMTNINYKFRNFFNNTPRENTFLCNLIISIFTVPCLEFDPYLNMAHNLLLIDDDKSTFSILNLIKSNVQEFDGMIRKNEYYPLFINIRKSEMGVNLIPLSIEKITNKNLVNLYKQELTCIDNLIIFIEFLKEFICVFSHKYKYENLVEEMFEMYSNMLDDYYHNEKKNEDAVENIGINNNIIGDNYNNDNFNEEFVRDNYEDNVFNGMNIQNNFGNRNYFENNIKGEAYINQNNLNNNLDVIYE